MKKKEKTSGSPQSINVALKKATSEMMVLSLLRQKPMYTYEVMHAIEECSAGTIVFNTIYLTIYRLQDFGYIQEHSKVMSEDNRTRIYFEITDSGAVYLEGLIQEYRRYIAALNQILDLS